MSVNTDRTNKLQNLIKQRIDDAGGMLSFEHFMQAALYEPKLGYYESSHVFGEGGDFVTGADLGQWLALGFADLMAWGVKQLESPKGWTLLEQGGGSGRLLVEVVENLRGKGVYPPRIVAVEGSALMRQRQAELYVEKNMQVEQFSCLSEVPHTENVLMFCNELPDAFPVHSFIWKDGQAYERGVGHSQAGFHWQIGEQIELLGVERSLKQAWPEGYVSEYNLKASAWQQQVADVMGQGYVFCVDYGYTQQEYYRSQRMEGTLMGHYEHQVVENVLDQVGQCDLTAHVDFSALKSAGEACGLRANCFMSQGAWLAQSPSVQVGIQDLALKPDVESMQALAHAKRMMLPFGMGESFKLLIQSKERDVVAPDYLPSFDHLRDL